MTARPMICAFTSFGNDSIALIRWLYVNGFAQTHDVRIIYNDTGWAMRGWAERVVEAQQWVTQLGMRNETTLSEGMEALVKRKKGWPRSGIQFCTTHLKIIPSLQLLDMIDPDHEAVCFTGVRREESEERKNYPPLLWESWAHGGRPLRMPLVFYTKAERNQLILDAGFKPLNHRSKECFCINSNKEGLKYAARNDPDMIAKVERIENEIPASKTGKMKTMFRPAKKKGATGIRAVIRWANEGHDGDLLNSLDDGTGYDCDSGFCGT